VKEMLDKDPIFDLEQQIMQCWHIVDDVDIVTEHFVDSLDWAEDHFSPKAMDAMMNKYFGIKELYDVKFQKLFETFEKVCREYHKRGNALSDMELFSKKV
jgi:hypothetical protein